MTRPARTGLTGRGDLRRDLAALGLRAGDTVLVHASLRALGWVHGGAATVVRALLDVLGPAGTIVVPAQTTGNTDPSRWGAIGLASVPESRWPDLRDHLPSFDPARTPSSGMGAVAEAVRAWPGAARSAHPRTSFAALGARGSDLTAGHELGCQLGEASPLARLEEVDGKILLLGVGFDVCTAFHLAEYRLPDPPRRRYSCVVATPAGRQWVSYADVALDAGDFAELGSCLEATGGVRRGPAGAGTGRLLRVRTAVEFARTWLAGHRVESGAFNHQGTYTSRT